MSRQGVTELTVPLVIVQKEGVSQEDMVSSSCQEPRSRSISVQTSPRLMKNTNKKSGGFRDSTDKPSKDVIDKVGRIFFKDSLCPSHKSYLLEVHCVWYERQFMDLL